MRWVSSAALGLLLAFALFWFMQAMVHYRVSPSEPEAPVDVIDVVEAEPPPDEPPPGAMAELESEPPPPPAVPDALARPDLPPIPVPALAAAPEMGPVKIPLTLGGGGKTLSGSGAFGGFGRGAGFGSGSGGGGGGKGQNFKGKDLVPLSTARPQIPQWAYERGIEGWVEVVFTVMPNGRVQDVKIIDAQPRGIFETIAIESISNWIYDSHPRARMVKQKVEFKLEDFQYNWK